MAEANFSLLGVPQGLVYLALFFVFFKVKDSAFKPTSQPPQQPSLQTAQ